MNLGNEVNSIIGPSKLDYLDKLELTWTVAHLPPPKANESISPLMKNMLSPVHLYTCHTRTHKRGDKAAFHVAMMSYCVAGENNTCT